MLMCNFRGQSYSDWCEITKNTLIYPTFEKIVLQNIIFELPLPQNYFLA